MIDEDEWPDPSSLSDYQPKFDADPSYYFPVDHIAELGVFLRDHTIQQRKMRVVQKREQERERAKQTVLY